MKNSRLGLAIVVTAGVAMGFSQALQAQVQPPSDVLTVNFGGINATLTLQEGTNGVEDVLNVGPFTPFLPLPGGQQALVILTEPGFDPDTGLTNAPSDFLFCVTGSSLQFYSDGASGIPSTNGFRITMLVETGRPQDVSQFFGAPAGSILITSDVPEPAAVALLGLGGWGLVSAARRRKVSSRNLM